MMFAGVVETYDAGQQFLAIEASSPVFCSNTSYLQTTYTESNPALTCRLVGRCLDYSYKKGAKGIGKTFARPTAV